MSRVCPSKLKIASSLIKEESKEREDAMDAAREGTLWTIVQLTSPHPRTRKRRHVRPRLSQQSRLGMIHQVKIKPNTRRVAASTHHQALYMCALWHEVTKVLAQVIVIVMMSYLLMSKLCKITLTMLRLALANNRK